MTNSLNVLKRRLCGGATGLFYIERPVFDVDIELQYPNVAMVPSLDEIQHAINEVAHQCIIASNIVSMWGLKASDRPPTSSIAPERSMHVHVAQDMRIVRKLVMLAGSMELLKQQVSAYIKPFHRYCQFFVSRRQQPL